MARYRFLAAGVGFCTASALALCGCNDYTTGQLGEPDGPLLITRLTVLDLDSRDVPIFTDTSAPADCNAPQAKDTPACQGDIFRDRYGILKSPPSPDSGEFMRVVFNKLPLLINGMGAEKVNKQPT